jgi:hypothetical protein
LYTAIGDETNENMIPTFSSLWTIKLSNIGNGDTDDRSGNRIATNGAGTWIVIGGAGVIYRSTNDGETWTSSTPVSIVACGTIAYGGGVFVVGGVSGGKLLYSTDNGASWAQATNPLTVKVWSIAYQNGFFLASNDGQQITKSTDGATWTQITDLGADSGNTIGAGGGYFVIVSNAGNYRATIDGVTWTDLGNLGAEANRANSIRYFNGRFFVAGANGNYLYTNPNSDPRNAANWNIFNNGIPLRSGAAPLNNIFLGIGYIQDKDILFIQDGTTAGILYWTTIARPNAWYRQSTNNWIDAVSGADAVYSAFNNTTIAIAAAQVDIDAYGAPVYGRCIIKFNSSALSSAPSTHFWVSGNYINDAPYVVTGYTDPAPINIVKT